MAIEFFDFGETFSEIDISKFLTDQARSVFRAYQKRPSFSIISIGRVDIEGTGLADVITVECINEQVPSRNSTGINVREKLALCFFETPQTPHVRALRKNFPVVPHLNHVPYNQPFSLCLYFEGWQVVERTWTPENFLHRILWWLTETANGSLHRVDQPVERLYFDAPFEIVLPPNFHNDIQNKDFTFHLQGIQYSKEDPFKLARGFFLAPGQNKDKQNKTPLCPITINLGNVVHGARERYPATLGELEDQLRSRDVTLLTTLKEQIHLRVGEQGVEAPLGNVLIILRLSIQREKGAKVEDTEVRAFWINREFTDLGVDLGFLVKKPGENRV